MVELLLMDGRTLAVGW